MHPRLIAIKFVLAPSGQKALDLFLEELESEDPDLHAEAITTLNQFHRFVGPDGSFYSYFSPHEGVKWTDSAGAKMLDDFFINNMLHEEMRFIRIGSDWDDWEVRGGFLPTGCKLYIEKVIVEADSDPKLLEEPREPMACPDCGKTGPFDIQGTAWFSLQRYDDPHPTRIECDYQGQDPCICKNCDTGVVDGMTVDDFIIAAKRRQLPQKKPMPESSPIRRMEIQTALGVTLWLPMTEDEVDAHCLYCPHNPDDSDCQRCELRRFMDAVKRRTENPDAGLCIYCGWSDYSQNMPVLYDGRDVCWECSDHYCSTCSKCGDMYETKELLRMDNGLIVLCPDCVKNETGWSLPKTQRCLPAGSSGAAE